MAGDWIKMRVDLGDDPAVIGISEMLGLSEDTVVGKLHRLWSWADKHTTNGATNGVTLKWVDRFVANQGFADALCKFNWLNIEGDTLIFPNFDRHNGASAKARVEATLRQRLSRKNRDEGVTGLERVITPRPFVKFVLERDGNRCVYCGHVPTGKESLGVDHLLPLTRGGKDAIENLVSCCNSCNNEKNDRTPEEFGLLPTFLMPRVTYVSQQICDMRVTEALPEKRREENINTKPIVTSKLVDDCPHEKIIELYHSTLPTMPSVKVWTEKRRKLLQARWREDQKRQDVDYWERFFGYVSKSDFLCGRTEKPFNCDLEWMLNASNFVKIIEGKYHAA